MANPDVEDIDRRLTALERLVEGDFAALRRRLERLEWRDDGAAGCLPEPPRRKE